MNPNTKKLLGAVVAAALAIAVYYGVVSQQQATNIQNQANQTLGTTPAAQQTSQAPGAPQAPANQPAQQTIPPSQQAQPTGGPTAQSPAAPR